MLSNRFSGDVGKGRLPVAGRFSVGKLCFFLALLLLAVLYALPNLFGDDWAVQLVAKDGSEVNSTELVERANYLLAEKQIKSIGYRKLDGGKGVELCFGNNDEQLTARDVLQTAMPDCSVALSLATRAPSWLQMLGAKPMRLGLDLRGGVHLLLAIDIDSYWPQYYRRQIASINNLLANEQVTVSGVPTAAVDGIRFAFGSAEDADRAASLLKKVFADYRVEILEMAGNRPMSLLVSLDENAKEQLSERVLEQTVQIVQNRVNELGVSEAVVQRQSTQHISVDLPGVQDIVRAKELLGKTATLRFQMVADISDSDGVQDGYEIYFYHNHKVALQPEIVLDGSAITYAVAGIDQWGSPAVQVELTASAAVDFHRLTAANVGKALAVVYSQMERICRTHQGTEHCFNLPDEKLISVATIRSALGDRFEISGLNSERTAEDLALLLRSGSLSAPVSVVHEVTVGPSMGAANIERGAWSLVVGLAVVAIFMVVYYSWFGLIADLVLLFNIVFMLAGLSILDATLTMAGMAGMVLTVGMAVDASVLILERIREELRAGYGGYMSIQMGYQRALATILDSNLSTLIISAVLFSLGSGAVKGFAVTLTIGLLTSMLTAVVYSKLMTEAVFEWYGRKHWGKRLPIGISIKN